MCFSAEASFAVGAALVPAGGYCVHAALRKNRTYLGLAAVPLLLAVQQISEGFVWLGLEHADAVQVRIASLFFLFFALALWPFWFSFMAALMETHWPRRLAFIGIALLATGWFWVLYFPLWIAPDSHLTTRVVHHSIQYHHPDLPIYQYIAKTPLRLLYLASVAVPMAISSESLGRLPGLALGLLAVAAALIYDYAFVSVWCFFAAVLALSCCYLFYQMPASR